MKVTQYLDPVVGRALEERVQDDECLLTYQVAITMLNSMVQDGGYEWLDEEVNDGYGRDRSVAD